MTWRWLICSSLAMALAPAPPASAGSVTGQVELTNSRDPAVRRHNYSGVVLWLEPIGHPAPPAAHQQVEMKQEDKTFKPHVVAIPVGSSVSFPNLDPIMHGVFSNFSGQPFELSLFNSRATRTVKFVKPGIVQVFCQIHPTMSAIIDVVPTPWFALTPGTGKFTIANVPPGEYELHIYHERALPENVKFLERRINVPDGNLALPLISITETGFTPKEHLDKHGMPYSKPPVEST